MHTLLGYGIAFNLAVALAIGKTSLALLGLLWSASVLSRPVSRLLSLGRREAAARPRIVDR